METTTLLIDADVIAVRNAASVQQPIEWGDGVWSMHANLEEAFSQVQSYITDLKRDVMNGEDCNLVLTFSDPSRIYFRHKILPSYKETRRSKDGPMLTGPLKDRMAVEYPTFLRPDLEADDVLGILATNDHLVPNNSIIVSVDKDLDTVPGNHYNPGKPEKGVYVISDNEADQNHLFQSLVGDPTDGYSGCPGVGPVTAKKLGRLTWKKIVGCYKKAGLNEADALVQARVARILRSEDYTISSKEIRLWNPTKK